MTNELEHIGVIRRSGRYPYGSGRNPYQRNKNFLAYVEELKSKGMSETEIAEGLGMSTTSLRSMKSLARSANWQADSSRALILKDKGLSNVAIGEKMGINESSVRALLDPARRERAAITRATSNMLKDRVSTEGFIDVGIGVERHMGISRVKLKTALEDLKSEGYNVYYIPVVQLGTGKKTYITTLAAEGVTYSEVYNNKDKIKGIAEYSEDGGRTYTPLEPPRNVDSKRVDIKYGSDGGSDMDGIIELRRNVDDISLGSARYAQVRIAVDGSHYLKGMAIYSDDLPKGVDIRFNTNKESTGNKLDAMKPLKYENDPTNPFGATIKNDDSLLLAQRHYIDKNGKKQLSSLNIVNEEGNWNEWSKTLSSQMLSKQSPQLAKKQLDLALSVRKDEYDEIMSYTNPAVRKKLLDSFADDADAASVHLKAASLPRQSSNVLIPITSMKENEIFAPSYRNGETVVLIRYPHGGTFEIPELKVNNKNSAAIKTIGRDAPDAIGINPKVAQRLSGADFDGDSVLVIPNNNKFVKTSPALNGLKNFDPKTSYPAYDGMPKMKAKTKQAKMGDVSNLITDMTIKGATADELTRAVKHSMVVIDAEKHHLNYKQSYLDNGIGDLKKKYQGASNAGASTLVSKSKSPVRVGERKLLTNTSRMTPEQLADYKKGKKVYEYTGETYVNKEGKTVARTETSQKMAEVSDARKLSSGTVIEGVYASYANDLKALANKARKESLNTKTTPYSPSAKEAYSKEVDTLKAKLNVALKNAPLERQAQLLAGTIVAAKKKDNPSMDADDIKKENGRALETARNRVGAGKKRVEISESEWAAIQAGAISNNTLVQILNNTDLDRVKQLATPRAKKTISSSKAARAKAMKNSGHTTSEIADALGISTKTVTDLLR